MVQSLPFFNIWYSFLARRGEGWGVKFLAQTETSSLPMTGLKYWRIFDTHGLWALISNTELSSLPRSCLFKELKNSKKHPMIKEQSCHQNTHVENTILFKKPRFNARWYSILFYVKEQTRPKLYNCVRVRK